MTELLKEQFFTKDSLGAMITVLSKVYPKLDKTRFKELIYDTKWKDRELKQKMRHVTKCMQKVLPNSYDESIQILLAAAPQIKGWECMTLPDYVEVFGRKFWDRSMHALTEFTKYGSSEFGIRPFLIDEPKKTISFLKKLTKDSNEKVRRFASEGCRPRHPWAMSLPLFKKNPSLVLPVLENLKNDESEYVRRSVANNLNDISKDNPDFVLEVASGWYGHTPNTDSLVKHACRTLLKAGDQRALTLFGFGSTKQLKVSNSKLSKSIITLGETLTITYSLKVDADKGILARLEYGVYFMKANGKQNRKVFKISEKLFALGSHKISKNHKFVDLTTRKHYNGAHKISIIVNGEEKKCLTFMLKK